MTGPRYSPMLARTAEAPFSSPDWIFEVKWDGIRAVAYAGETLSLLSRSGRDMSGQFPELREILELAPGCVLDGEIVLLRDGRNDIQALLGRFQESDPRQIEADSLRLPVTYVAFDILEADGAPLVHLPLEERRRILGERVKEGKYLVRSVAVRGDGERYYAEAARRGLEGVMAKRLGSPYRPGARSDAWLKVKAVRTCDCVVFGYTKGGGARAGTFGALVLGLCDGKKGVYIGRVGTGFDDAALASFLSALDPLRVDSPTLEGAEKGEITWVRPRMVVEVAYQAVTRDGRLRMPRFLRVRTDKAPQDCTPDQLGTGRNLLPYQAKRDFSMTPEPKGKGPAGPAGNSFVVHEHRARHLHWDLRMERDGVLKSWAVPKGVPEAAGEKHLAVATEDHPLEYLTFEGTIPEGEYGAGTEAIWDTGTYDTVAWDEGKIEVVFHGRRLSGRYALVRFRPGGRKGPYAKKDAEGKDWLLLKAGDG
ncbi:MAG: non-homologous end-joining DNA ligase [Methanomicrobiales archaeon]|nr:non-homologous end-joining DNA ligase [Methanomicrobiales archaeon]